MIGVKALTFDIPSNLVPIRDLPEIEALDNAARKVFELTMADMQTVAVDEEHDNVDLAVRAAREAIEEAEILPSEVGLLIFLQSRAPSYMMASEATRTQHQLGANKAVALTAGGLGCANISGALQIARSFLTAHQELEHVLICGASKPFGTRRYREAVTLVGDAGMGVILSRCDRNRILEHDMITQGKFWDLFRVEYKDRTQAEYVEACTSERYKFELAITSRNNFRALRQQIFDRQNMDEADAYIMQNLSPQAFSYNEEALAVRFLTTCRQNCARYGHLGGIDILLNYSNAIEQSLIEQGDRVLIQNNSPAACWSTTLVEV